jgi:hypothetical protein
MMQSCASAAKLRAAGPILSVGIVCHVTCRFPPPRIVNQQSALNASASAEYVRCSSRRSFQPAGRRMTSSNVSPVVTKRQSAMSSLRANPTIIVLRVPSRLSAVRARYHCASALCF